LVLESLCKLENCIGVNSCRSQVFADVKLLYYVAQS